jgi:hypothetical protein
MSSEGNIYGVLVRENLLLVPLGVLRRVVGDRRNQSEPVHC